MNEKFDDELTALLHKHFGEDWEFNWDGMNGGFALHLWVWNQPDEETVDKKFGEASGSLEEKV